MHADIKPDNILITKSKETCKLSDFGNAVYVDDLQKCQEMVARFYRAPEIILGHIQFNFSIQISTKKQNWVGVVWFCDFVCYGHSHLIKFDFEKNKI